MPGARGERGERGLPGFLPLVKIWRQDEITREGECVTYGGECFQAMRDLKSVPGGEGWQRIAAAGTPGRDMVIRGTYDESESYHARDLVACNGGSFIARKDNPGECPGPDWQLVASPGKKGEKGLPGEQGLKGERGEAGVSFAGFDIDRANFRIVAKMSNGSEHMLDMRGLFEEFIRVA
jgi:hypothetical protein